MGIWQVGADTLAQSRFAVSALAETVAMLHALGDRSARIGQQEWIEARRAAYAERLAADPFEGRFVAQALRPRWLPDFMCRPPRDADQTFGDELRRVREEAPLDVALADLAEGGATADWLEVPDLAARVADLLEWVWTHCVEPDWERRRRIFEADIVARTQQLSSGGWAAALSGLRQEMVWLGDGKLCINAYDNPPRATSPARVCCSSRPRRHGGGYRTTCRIHTPSPIRATGCSPSPTIRRHRRSND